jgi:hypothetical protein
MKYVLVIEGQETPLDESIAANDDVLRTTIAAYMPQLANAEIQRQTQGDTVRIQMLKRAGTKGSVAAVCQELDAAPPQLNPALSLVWQLEQLKLQKDLDIAALIALQPQIEAAYTNGQKWEVAIANANLNLCRAPATPARIMPKLI